mmetsp:Transcript_24318/g.34337  ORF Transcript_24318/g.34337 Transcript_24318/m.34337 type:complete len:477 (-) Transcript_24318:206-1636(-)|eukprot:CAMPEP_0175104532 /NCGR_PEP_ID=MMETSP0086_2-20121207/9800_1 /TAXON_ID=136419 /ORGANISM="Unknown Unknown, Strain D1" /LENGTH=476 /DNA_ID=CAMNT_0016379975 /DNA_START=44 /DNA_END=1474 /DNA_ORIENTATION=+
MGNLCVNQCYSVPCWEGYYTEYKAVQDPNYKGYKPGFFCCNATGLYIADPGSEEALQEDARLLYKAMKGLGTRESDLVRVLCNRSQAQLTRIKEIFKANFDPEAAEDPEGVLERWIIDDTSGDFKNVLLALLKDRAYADAKVVKQAIDGELKIGIGTIDKQLREIFTTRTPADMKAIAAAYEKLYNKPLQEAVKSDTSFRYQDTLMALADRADYLAQRLHGAMINRPGTDNMRLIRILTSINRYNDRFRSICNEYDDTFRLGLTEELSYELTLPSMSEVMAAYEKRYGATLVEHVASETSLQYRDTLMVLLEDPAKVIAHHIHYAIQGAGTEDDMLIELLTCHSNRELIEANVHYQKEYGMSIYDAVKGDTSGGYQSALLDLCIPREFRMAEALFDALDGAGTRDYRLVAGLSGKSRRQIWKVSQAYEERYGRKLEDDVRNDTSFWYRRTLTYIIRQATEAFHWMAPRNFKRIRDV